MFESRSLADYLGEEVAHVAHEEDGREEAEHERALWGGEREDRCQCVSRPAVKRANWTICTCHLQDERTRSRVTKAPSLRTLRT